MAEESTQGASETHLNRRTVLRAGITGAFVTGVIGSAASAVRGKSQPGVIIVDDRKNADYQAIQDAIDAATTGDTVEVRSGEYTENVTIDVEDLTLTGTGNAVVDGDGTSQAAVTIDANGVTVERLRVQNPDGLIGIGIGATNDLSDVTVQHNRVSNVGSFARDNLGVTGIISSTNQNNLSIVGNTVSGLSDNISLQGIFLNDENADRVDARIAGNSISDIDSSEGGAMGILLQVPGSTVDNNRVRGLTGRWAQGVNVAISNGGDTTIKSNTFEGISGSSYDGEGVKIDGGDVSSLTITQNNLLPTVGINNAVSGEEVSATCNYWDSPSGPEAAGNPDGTGSKVMGDVEYTPWNIGRIGRGGNAGNTCRGGQ